MQDNFLSDLLLRFTFVQQEGWPGHRTHFSAM